MSDYLVLTGCTGLLGRYLLRDLLLDGHRVAVVARPSRKESASERVEGLMQHWERQGGTKLPRPICLSGDLSQPALGLSSEDQSWMAANCRAMLHSAASLTFHADGSGEPYNTNVNGTRHVLDLCKLTGIRDLHYVSTAYVCGLREGRILETDLDYGQRFRNDYEKTKLEAETLVRSEDFLEKLTVYRPAVIAGDSRTGYTNTYHGLYMYLKLMSVLVRNTPPSEDGVRDTPVRLEMTGDEPRNIIPVDWVSAVMCHLLGTPEAHGKTFHLAPETPLTPREIIEAGYTYFNSRGVEFAGPSKESQRISEMDSNAHDNMGIYKEYEISDPEFDLTNLHKFAGHLPCPFIDDDMLHRFWRYGEEDRWGKRRPPRSEPCQDIGAICRDSISTKSTDSNGRRLSIHLRALGPGGGDWLLHVSDGRLVELERGVASQADASFQIDSDRFLWLLRQDHDQFPLSEVEKCLTASPVREQKVLTALCSALFGVTVDQGQVMAPPAQDEAGQTVPAILNRSA